MKYIVTQNNNNNRVTRRRVWAADPRTLTGFTLPPHTTVHEVSDAEGDAHAAVLDNLEEGEYASFDGTTLTVVRAVDASGAMPFKRQLRMVIAAIAPNVRRQVIDIIGPSLALDDVDSAIAALTAYDASGLPARLQQLKADLLTVLGRESLKRQGT